MTRINVEALLERGDRAARAGNAAELREVAMLLSARIGDPLAATLLQLANDCYARTTRAWRAWPPVRRAVARRVSFAGT
jgi:hypothetical protein